MSEQTENPPAFPQPDSKYPVGPKSSGMTLRDYLAGQALIGLISHRDIAGPASISRQAYEYADAMLKERVK